MAGAVRLNTSAAWLLVCTLAAAGSLLAWGLEPALLDWRPERWSSHPWRWWTAALVHWSPLHLAANLGATLLVAALGIAAGCGRRAAAAWALAWPLTQLALLLQPGLQRYGGLSGVLHAGVAVAAVQLLRNGRGRRSGVGLALIAGLLLKILLEAPWRGPLRQVAGWDFPIAPLAHAAGAAAGLCCGLLMLRRGRRDRAP